jgi:SAM-dependent methyltransferase
MMFSPEWNQLYRDGRHNSTWPWSDMVSYVCRGSKPSDGFRRVLELGCGVGANIPFFLDLGADYWAIEGSEVAVDHLHQKWPQLRGRIVTADFTQTIPFDGPFDLVVDRSAVTHNTTAAIRRAHANAFQALRAGGRLIGIDWFSSCHSDAAKGRGIDSHTRAETGHGHLAGTGAVHFSDQEHLVELLTEAGFRVERLEHKWSEVVVPDDRLTMAWWNFLAVKP